MIGFECNFKGTKAWTGDDVSKITLEFEFEFILNLYDGRLVDQENELARVYHKISLDERVPIKTKI